MSASPEPICKATRDEIALLRHELKCTQNTVNALNILSVEQAKRIAALERAAAVNGCGERG